jgi:MHS family proline/betaine transporter-like MFS transporter
MRQRAKIKLPLVQQLIPEKYIPEKQSLGEASQQEPSPLKGPIFFISVLGTILEYFEYAIYGFLAPALALHFFPAGDPEAALIKTFGVFAVGSLSKPLGALIFGYWGDRQGRRISLRYSMIGISFPTFIVGILPGYEAWGWGAAFTLVLCRMFQGIFIAGESDGVRIYVFEHFQGKYPCLRTALVGCGAYFGIAAASFVASQIPSTGETWRFVFLGCSIFGVIVFALRRYLIETPPFLAYQKKNLSSPPLKDILRSHWRPIIRAIMICGGGGGAYHFYLVFQGTYLSNVLGFVPTKEGALYGFFLTCAYVLILPLAGWTADIWGLARTGTIAGVISIGLIAMNVVMVMNKIVFVPLLLLTTLSVAFCFTPGYNFLMRDFDVGVRFRSLSLGHTIGSMLFSGSTPFVCLLLWQNTGVAYLPYVYFLCLVLMGTTAFIWGARDRRVLLPLV